MAQRGIKEFFDHLFRTKSQPVKHLEVPAEKSAQRTALEHTAAFSTLEKGVAADESERLAALNLNLDYIDISLDQVKAEFGDHYLEALFEHSPYEDAQKAAVEKGDLDTQERLSAEECGWAVDALIYKTRPKVYGLLSEAAKECLKNDLMIPAPLVDIFDNSREGYTRAAESFNHAVETGSSEMILFYLDSLFFHAESYEFEKMEREKINREQIAETLIGRYGRNIESGYAAYRERTAKLAPSKQNKAPAPFQPRKAPMLSQHTELSQGDRVCRAAPVLQVSEARVDTPQIQASGQPFSL